MKKIIITVLCATMAVCNALNAQVTMKENNAFSVAELSNFKSHNSNPWGLVYADALTENKAGAVNIQPITYELDGLRIAANIYLPASYDEAKSYPALVVAHPNGGVKEQVAGLSRCGRSAYRYSRHLRRWRLHAEGGADRQAFQSSSYTEYVQHGTGTPQWFPRFANQ